MVKFIIYKKRNSDKFTVRAKNGDPPVKSKSTTKTKATRQIKKLGMLARLANKSKS